MSKLQDHIDFLHEKIFFTATKWPQYKLLLNDLQQLNHMLEDGDTVFSFERNKMYGGFSPFSPLFPARSFHSFDRTPDDAKIVFADIDDKRFIGSLAQREHAPYTADLVIVHNLLHHIKHQYSFFDMLHRRATRYIYIFEPLSREIHQAPHHYVQYTPYGLRDQLEKNGFKVVWEHETGGPFTQCLYYLLQAQEYIPEEDREPEEELRQMVVEAEEMDRKRPTNLVRGNTRGPTAFSILVEKV